MKSDQKEAIHNRTCFIIVGPTAVGKTSLAALLAERMHTSIISADSRQCYREMDIGVAKPAAELLERIPHYFINSHSITEGVTAASFEQYALSASEEIFSRHQTLIMVGGTGLYIQAFCQGLDEIPPADPNTRNHIKTFFDQSGLQWLLEQIREHDPAYLQFADPQNPQRLMRALEVKLSTGNSILDYQTKNKKQRDFAIRKIGLDLPRDQLYGQIDERTNQMIATGLIAEAESLYPFRKLNALNTVGYKELFEYFDGKLRKEEAIALIRQHTRNYAKRQLTWFRKDKSIKWYSSGDAEKIWEDLETAFR